MTTHLDDILFQSALLRQVSDQIRFAFIVATGALARFRLAAVGGKKSLLADDAKFLGSLVRLMRCDVRDHIDLYKNDR